MATPLFINSTTASVANGSSYIINVPAGVTAGDLLVFASFNRGSNIVTTTINPSDFTVITSQARSTSGVLRLYYKIANGSETSWSITLAGSGSSNTQAGGMALIRGINQTNPLHASTTNSSGTSTTNSVVPSITTTINQTLLLHFTMGAVVTNGLSWTWDSPSIEQYDVSIYGSGTGAGSMATDATSLVVAGTKASFIAVSNPATSFATATVAIAPATITAPANANFFALM